MIDISVKFTRDQQKFNFETSLPSTGITAIFGKSGAGKTTFLDLLSGIEKPDSGFIKVNQQVYFDAKQGINIAAKSRNIGVVFQDNLLFPHMNVLENVRYAGQQQDDLERVINLLDIEPLLHRRPAKLSGGEQKRVAIARALMMSPSMLLLDEPFSGLDVARKMELMDYFSVLADHYSIPILLVSHHVEEIFPLANQLMLIDSGTIVGSGDLVTLWSDISVRSSIANSLLSSLLVGRVTRYHEQYDMSAVSIGDGEELWVTGKEWPINAELLLNILAQDVTISRQRVKTSIRNCIKATVIDIDRCSHESTNTVECSVNGQRVLSNITDWALDDLALKKGTQCHVLVKSIRVGTFSKLN